MLINYKKQTGVALITVVLIAAAMILMVTQAVKSLAFQQQLNSNLIHRDQGYSYLMGMEDLAKIYLKKAFDNVNQPVVNLGQEWARDDIVFPFEGGQMQASVKDLQSCFNLNSIAYVANNNGNNNNPNNFNNEQNQPPNPNALGVNGFAAPTTGQRIFEELINQLRLDGVSPQALASTTRDWIDEDDNPAGPDGAEDEYYTALEPAYRTANGLIAHTSELRSIKDFNAEVYNKLLPYICVLPEQRVNQINVNTIDNEHAEKLLYAILNSQQIQVANIKQAIDNRGKNGYETVEEFIDQLGVQPRNIPNLNLLSVTSDYFLVDAVAQMGKTRVHMKSVFKRDSGNNFEIVSRYFGRD